MIRVGITGSVASGKSSVSALFGEHGAKIIDADEIVSQLEVKDGAAYKGIVERFGKEILLPGGELDRRGLGAVVFSDERARRDLEAIVHPLVEEEIRREVRDAAKDSCSVVVLDIPLLIETGGRELYDLHGVLVVDAPIGALRARLSGRGLSKDEAARRLDAHPPSQERLSAADYVIVNSAGISELREMAERAWNWVKSLGDSDLGDTDLGDKGLGNEVARPEQDLF